MNISLSWFTGAAFICGLAGCQGHLPTLETAPNESGPKTADVINHIACEISTVVNYHSGDAETPLNKRIKARITDTPDVEQWLKELVDYHFIATAQISVEVTDNEGFAPSLGILNKSGGLTVGLGGQLTGTQDRSLTLNYAMDLSNLSELGDQYCSPVRNKPETTSQGLGLSGAIGGDLGMADIIADGLIALHTSEAINIYGSSGPVPALTAKAIDGDGTIVLPVVHSAAASGKPAIDLPRKDIHIEKLAANAQFAPQAPGTSSAGTVTLAGVASLVLDGKTSDYFVNWSGSILPQGGDQPAGALVYFSLAGNLTPLAPTEELATSILKSWGYSPSVTLTGSINSSYNPATIQLSGVVGASPNSDYEKAMITLALSAHAKKVDGKTPETAAGPGGAGGAPVKGGAGAGSAAGGTSFGSLVDFVLVYGLNGGPNWTFKRFKGPATGSSPLLTGSRTKTDSLAITFVATCQDFDSFAKVPTKFTNYWDTIGACNDTTRYPQQLGASVGYQNNSLMILRNFLVKP
jgi:hypothetical protein